jgi:hypothetical protein
MKINPLRIFTAIFVLFLFLGLTNKAQALTVNLGNPTVGQNFAQATVSINKPSFNTGDQLLLTLNYPKTVGVNTILAGYRVTNNSSFNYNPQIPFKTGFWADDPIPNGMIINSDVIKTDLNNKILLTNLQPGNYTLFVLFRTAYDLVPNYIDNTTIPTIKQQLEQPVLYDGIGQRYSWDNTNLFFSTQTNGTNDIGIATINFTVSNTVSTPSFDFGISNDGNKTIIVGDSADSVISLTNLNAGATGDVTLNVDSIKNSSGVDVKDLSTGLIVGSTAFGQRTLTPTANTTLRVQSLGSTVPGTYTVKVTGTYTKQATTVVNTTNTTPAVYYCKTTWTHDTSPTMYNGFYFGCSTDSNFSPISDYNNGGQFSVKCIQFDDGNCLANTNSTTLGSIGRDKIRDQRIAVATGPYGCGAGGYTVTGDPYNVSTGFTCNSVPVNTSITTGGQTITHSTTYNIDVQSAPLAYNLTAVRSGDSCNLNDLKITASWNPIPGASSYRLYRYNPNEPDKVYSTTTPYYIVAGKITFEDKILAFSELYKYKVSAIVSGAEQAKSPSIYAFSPTYLTGANCPQTVASPSIKLFAKESTDTTKDLSIYSLTTTTSASNTDVSLFAGKTFDIRWVSNLTPDYTCRQETLDTTNNTNNSIWIYGTGSNSTITGLSSSNKTYGTYKLSVTCTNTAGTTVTSNISRITIKEVPPVYNFTLTTSGDQCSATDIWIKESWSPVPGASSYNVYRVKDVNPQTTVFNVVGTSNNEVYPSFTFSTGEKYNYSVRAVVGGVEKASSPVISVIAPLEGCQTGTRAIKLYTKKNTDTNINFSNYTFQTPVTSSNNSATVVSGEKFDLLWISNLTPDYTVCNQKTITPSGITNNSIWSYGGTYNGQVTGLDTTGLEIGNYTFSVSCTNGTVVVSNTAKLTIQPAPAIPPDYQFTVTPSTDKCVPLDLWVSQTWNSIPNASSYTIKRLNTVTGKIDATYTLSGSATMNTEKYPSFNTGTKYNYIISAVVSGKTLTSSPIASIVTPKVTTLGCPVSSLNLGIKKSVDMSYTSSASVNKGDTFDLQWVMSNPPSGYTCSFSAVKPDGSSGNSIWAWGGTMSDTNTSLPTNMSSVIDGSYVFSITCTKANSPTVNSNSVTLSVTTPTTPPPPPPPPTGGGNGGNNGGQNPPPPAPPVVTSNPKIKLFIGGSGVVDKPVTTPVVGDPKAVVPYKVGPTGTFNLAWKSNNLSGYSCTSVTIKPDGSDGSAVWNWFNNSLNGNALGLEAKIAETGTYSFFFQCSKISDPDVKEFSNTVLLRISNAGEI